MSKFKVGDMVRLVGFHDPRRVLEVWRGRKQPRYLLGMPVLDGLDFQPIDGVWQVEKLVDEDKLQPA